MTKRHTTSRQYFGSGWPRNVLGPDTVRPDWRNFSGRPLCQVCGLSQADYTQRLIYVCIGCWTGRTL